jgi:hypothetical protein
MNEETIAERIERRFHEYGELLREAGLNIYEVCVAAGGEVEREGVSNLWHYEFPDGSCLSGGIPGLPICTWDKE